MDTPFPYTTRFRSHLKSVIVPSVQSPPSMLKLHDFCNRAGPLAPHLDGGFIQAPARIKATPPEPAQALLHLRCVALDPAIDRRMVDRNAAFRQHFLKVAIADRIATIPAHRPQ